MLHFFLLLILLDEGGCNTSYGARDSPDQVLGIMGAWVRNLGLIETLDAFMGQKKRYGMDSGRNRWLIFQGQMPGRMPTHRHGGFDNVRPLKWSLDKLKQLADKYTLSQ